MPATAATSITPLQYEKNKELLKWFHGERTAWVQVGPKKFLFPSKFTQNFEGMRTFKSRPDDVWVCTFPRSGTTLTQEMAWVIANNFDFESAKKIQLAERFPFFEFNCYFHDEIRERIAKENNYDTKLGKAVDSIFEKVFNTLEDVHSQRFMKTHLPLSLLPEDLWATGAKVIYVARNPKDVAVSYYHLMKLWRTLDFKGDFQQFWSYFEEGLVNWGPFWEHVKEGWEYRNKPNVLFLLYEDMVKDLPKAIDQVSQFLGIFPTADQVRALADHLDVKNFKANPAVNFEHLRGLKVLTDNGEPFIRTGKVGGHENIFTEELSKRANQWIEENYKTTELRFPS